MQHLRSNTLPFWVLFPLHVCLLLTRMMEMIRLHEPGAFRIESNNAKHISLDLQHALITAGVGK